MKVCFVGLRCCFLCCYENTIYDFFFFFQAEDGIRDLYVTGVQTCALPISLARHKEWYFAKCPQCGAPGRRETDVSDTFLDSAWYFLRYPSTEFHDRPWDEQRTRTWLPVSTYIGGNEHAVLHLLYSRFVTMALQELGLVHFDE